MNVDWTKILISLLVVLITGFGGVLTYLGNMILNNQEQTNLDLAYVRAEVQSIKRGKTLEELADYFAGKDSITANEMEMLTAILLRDRDE